MADPYQTLGVARGASQDEIRSAYRKLAKKHHPDLNPGNAKAEETFKTVSVANDLLSDPDKRARFDRGEIDQSGQERPRQPSYRNYAEGDPGRRYSRAGESAEGWNADDLGEIFGSMFNEQNRASEQAPRRGRDEHYTLKTAFLDAINGATRRLTLPDGRTLDVVIPPGTSEGQTLRLRGQGGQGHNGGPAGDALIEIKVASHRHFKRDGRDIRLDLPVSLREAVLGAAIEVPTPGGHVRMQIPPASDNGAALRLRGRGVPAHAGSPAGDLYATLRVVLGKPDPALEEFLSNWTPEHPIDPRKTMEERHDRP